jgi:hypothetical protein
MADDSSEIVKEAAESVAFENVKVGGGTPSFYAGLAMGNAVANQQQVQASSLAIATAIQAKAAEMVLATSPAEGAVDVAVAQILAKMAEGAGTKPGVIVAGGA